MLTIAYIAVGLLGCGYIIVSALIGHTTDAPGGHDATGHADAAYGVDGNGHGSASAEAGHDAAFHFPFFSPLALAALCGSMGAWGLIAKFGIRVSDRTSLLIAIPAAFVTAYIITYAGHQLITTSRGSSAIRVHQFSGLDAEVITSIPEGGVGEAATIIDGQRFTSAAREVDGRAVARGTNVKVVRMAGGTMTVSISKGDSNG